jgi:pSer/pThr/pTyr-binding forkhead associated (FHA) protein
VVAADPALDVDPDPAQPCPTNEPERLFPLDLAENLVGRRDDRRDIHPEVAIRDPGVSRRHAMLYREPDGTLAVLDLNSSNGTQLNGTAVEAGVKTPLNDGDELVIGRWTRLTVRARQ